MSEDNVNQAEFSVYSTKLTENDLINAAVLMGHNQSETHPLLQDFIAGQNDDTTMFQSNISLNSINNAAQFLYQLGMRGGNPLWVGIKNPIVEQIIQQAAEQTNSCYVIGKWIKGTLTNFSTIRNGFIRKVEIKNLLEQTTSSDILTKRERGVYERQLKSFSIGSKAGIEKMKKLPQAVIIVGLSKDYYIVKETFKSKIPSVVIVDNNINPQYVDYPIYGNDDSSKSVSLIISELVSAYIAGTESRGKNKTEKISNVDKFSHQIIESI